MERLGDNVKEQLGSHEVQLVQLLTEEFLRQHTRYRSLEAMLQAWEIVEGQFEKLSAADKDRLTIAATRFTSWQNMLDVAVADYTKKKMFE